MMIKTSLVLVVVALCSYVAPLVRADVNVLRTCFSASATFDQLPTLTALYVVNEQVKNEIGTDGLYTLSSCTHTKDGNTLEIYGTHGWIQNPTNDTGATTAAFACDMKFNNVTCSSCRSCQGASSGGDPLVIAETFVWYDCSGIDDDLACSQDNSEACSNQVGEQKHENCLPMLSEAPTRSPSAANTYVTMCSQALAVLVFLIPALL